MSNRCYDCSHCGSSVTGDENCLYPIWYCEFPPVVSTNACAVIEIDPQQEACGYFEPREEIDNDNWENIFQND